MEPVVVICAINHRPSVGRALVAVFNTYHEAPVRVVTLKLVPPVVKYSNTLGERVASCTKDGSSAPGTPDDGPSSPIVA